MSKVNEDKLLILRKLTTLIIDLNNGFYFGTSIFKDLDDLKKCVISTRDELNISLCYGIDNSPLNFTSIIKRFCTLERVSCVDDEGNIVDSSMQLVDVINCICDIGDDNIRRSRIADTEAIIAYDVMMVYKEQAEFYRKVADDSDTEKNYEDATEAEIQYDDTVFSYEIAKSLQDVYRRVVNEYC